MRGVYEIATLLGNDTGSRRRGPDVARAVLHCRAPAFAARRPACHGDDARAGRGGCSESGGLASPRVLGDVGFMFTTGLLTFYVALTSFRARVRGVAGVMALAGLASIGLMAVVNFMIASDFKWLILSFVLPWALALGLYWKERGDS